MLFQVMDIQACNDKIFQYILIRPGVEISMGIATHASFRVQKYMYAYRGTCVCMCVYIYECKRIYIFKTCLCVCTYTSGSLL